uniref:Uncharacterized protein n=1 Tax=Brugia pahangi TaxID=6280 RepID=A0A0N4TZW9_BRUPA
MYVLLTTLNSGIENSFSLIGPSNIEISLGEMTMLYNKILNDQTALFKDTSDCCTHTRRLANFPLFCACFKGNKYPIAKVATKLVVDYLLDEIRNNCVSTTPAAFKPVVDYVVISGTDCELSASMKSVGEVKKEKHTFVFKSVKIRMLNYVGVWTTCTSFCSNCSRTVMTIALMN